MPSPQSDVFLSYASADRSRALQVAKALEASGLSVWWDRNISAGQTFDEVIERELESARTVVVLWSNVSVASEWVKNEAARAAERGVLVPAVIDQVKLPLEFRRRQTADLSAWRGDVSEEGFTALLTGIMHSRSTGGSVLPQRIPQGPSRRWSRRGLLIACALTAGAALALGTYFGCCLEAEATVPSMKRLKNEFQRLLIQSAGFGIIPGERSGSSSKMAIPSRLNR